MNRSNFENSWVLIVFSLLTGIVALIADSLAIFQSLSIQNELTSSPIISAIPDEISIWIFHLSLAELTFIGFVYIVLVLPFGLNKIPGTFGAITNRFLYSSLLFLWILAFHSQSWFWIAFGVLIFDIGVNWAVAYAREHSSRLDHRTKGIRTIVAAALLIPTTVLLLRGIVLWPSIWAWSYASIAALISLFLAEPIEMELSR